MTIPTLYGVKNQKEHFCCTDFEIAQNQAVDEGRIQSMHLIAEIGSYTQWELKAGICSMMDVRQTTLAKQVIQPYHCYHH